MDKSAVWEYPPLSLLSDVVGEKAQRGDIKSIASTIEKTLKSFGVEARVAEVNLGATITQYAIEVAAGTRISEVTALAGDLALATQAPTGQIRIEAPIPGRNLIGLEIVNITSELVRLKQVLSSQVMQQAKSKLALPLGLNVVGFPLVTNLARLPHLLIAGNARSGKTTVINSFITSLLFRASPTEVKLILIDTKNVDMSIYNGIPHLLTPALNAPEKILSALKWLMAEIDRRHKTFAEKGVRNIDSYNQIMGYQALPYIVTVIDDMEALLEDSYMNAEDAIVRITRLGHSAGVHMILATQKPNAEVFSPQIKSNIPARIGLFLPRKLDYSVSLDIPDTDRLLGKGDMFFLEPELQKPVRAQGIFVSESEIQNTVSFLTKESKQ
ncbi:MAG TPA: DNA translocase FtsK [Candidatus Saccharimonadales bacterium]|nr:DNA translocase FtsK [Candidatus Saccharimonadales bacterium]